jgi:hypothetical protein
MENLCCARTGSASLSTTSPSPSEHQDIGITLRRRQRRHKATAPLAVLVDSPVKVSPPPGDLQVGLVDEPPVAGDVINHDAALDEHPPADDRLRAQ